MTRWRRNPRRRVRRRTPNPAYNMGLSPEQIEQKKEANELLRNADVMIMGVAEYIKLDTSTADDAEHLGRILIDAANTLRKAGAVLNELDEIRDRVLEDDLMGEIRRSADRDPAMLRQRDAMLNG